ncbi:hypothetical protein [Nocardioides sp. J54]|uniref:hypothetical protein n=1 Tax=Nocardioides sp. J54 TaxID=935866 RepID=UPI00048D5F78|nr:hypothetical protein [Nocardioides sp. J54]
MSANAQHFATVVLEAFKAARHFTVDQVVAAGGPSTTTMTKLRKASEGEALSRPRGDTMRKIDVAAGWPDGSAEVLWETGTLPDQEVSRAIGSGGVPAPSGGIVSSETRVERLNDRVLYRARTVAIDVEGRETALELVYEPGDGREVNLMDLGPIASSAHREAMRWTYLSGTRVAAGQAAPRKEGGEADGDAAATSQPGSGPDSGAPGLRLAPAARDVGRKGKAQKAREKQDQAGTESQDRGGMDPV